MKIMLIAQNTFREAVRNKILYSVVLFAVVLVAVSAFFGSVSIGDQGKVIKDFGLFSLSFFGAVITILSGVTLLNKELKQKTIYNILSKPVPRWQFVLGKHLGLSATVGFLVVVMGIALVAFVACFEQRIDWLLFQAIYFVVLEVIVVAAVALFFSSLVVTTTLTGLFTLGFYIAGRSISYFAFFTNQPEYKGTALAYIVSALNWIVPDLNVLNVSNQLVYGVPATGAQFGLALVYALCYSAVALTFSALIFERRELV
jgi:Cu-processing system permease protein